MKSLSNLCKSDGSLEINDRGVTSIGEFHAQGFHLWGQRCGGGNTTRTPIIANQIFIKRDTYLIEEMRKYKSRVTRNFQGRLLRHEYLTPKRMCRRNGGSIGGL